LAVISATVQKKAGTAQQQQQQLLAPGACAPNSCRSLVKQRQRRRQRHRSRCLCDVFARQRHPDRSLQTPLDDHIQMVPLGVTKTRSSSSSSNNGSLDLSGTRIAARTNRQLLVITQTQHRVVAFLDQQRGWQHALALGRSVWLLCCLTGGCGRAAMWCRSTSLMRHSPCCMSHPGCHRCT
jgi:hypothetical protein